jgi:hypothetical protein
MTSNMEAEDLMHARRGPILSLFGGGTALSLVLAGGFASVSALPGEDAAQPADTATTVSLTYQAIEDWDIVLPRETWTAIQDSIAIPHADGSGFAAEKVGPLKLRVDTNADGELDKDVKGADGFLTLRAKDLSGKPFEYSVRFVNEAGTYKFAASGAMVGKLNSTPIKLIDQNNNGSYCDYGRDAIVVGAAKGATLLSRVLSADGELLEIEVSPDGASLSSRPWVGDTGTLDVATRHASRGTLESAVFESEDGNAFNVIRGEGGMKVPVGSYRFVYGFVRKGAETVNMRTGKMAPIEVRSGSDLVLEWGGPLVAEFDYAVANETITVKPNVAFYGSAGEEYFTFKPDAKSPKIIVADKNTQKIYLEGRFGGC